MTTTTYASLFSLATFLHLSPRPPFPLLPRLAYASKSFWDPVHSQLVYHAWVGEQWTIGAAAAAEEAARPWWEHPRRVTGGGCVNASVCGTHTLPRAVQYDATLGALPRRT